jgi:hypothetical protein
MSSSEKFNKVMELNELTRSLFKQGLKKRFPNKSEQELHVLFLKRWKNVTIQTTKRSHYVFESSRYFVYAYRINSIKLSRRTPDLHMTLT